LKLETKVFILISLVFIISLSMINFINLYYINDLIEKYQQLQDILKQRNQLPATFQDNLNSYKSEYSKMVILWETFLVFGSIISIYYLTSIYLKKEERYKQFLQLMILSISHKLGNKISSLNINLELIKPSCNNQAVNRLEKSLISLNEDLKTLLSTFKKLQFERKEEEKFRVDELVLNFLEEFKPFEKKVFLRLKPLKSFKNKSDIEAIIQIILENAFKYSENKVYIKIYKTNLIVKNDIKNEIESGSGLGLLIVEGLSKLNNLKVIKRVKGKYFTVCLTF
jgi:signal transduction histidine kinase